MTFHKEVKSEYMKRMDVFAETVNIISKNHFFDVHVVMALQDTAVEIAVHKNKFVVSNRKLILKLKKLLSVGKLNRHSSLFLGPNLFIYQMTFAIIRSCLTVFLVQGFITFIACWISPTSLISTVHTSH